MGVEEPLDDEAPAEAPPKKAGSKVLLLVIISVLLVALLGVGGFIAYKQFAAPPEDTAAEGSEEAAPEKEKASQMGQMMGLEPFIVNLQGESGKRYLKVTMQLELSRGEVAEELGNKMPQVKDAIITVLSSKSTEELLTIEGKFKLKEQVLTRVNTLLTMGVVKNVYFVEFVIQ